MRTMTILCAALLSLGLLSGCGTLEQAKDLTAGDLLRRVDENHTYARALRAEERAIVESITEKCKSAVAASQDYEAAMVIGDACSAYIEAKRPALTVLELGNEVAKDSNTVKESVKVLTD